VKSVKYMYGVSPRHWRSTYDEDTKTTTHLGAEEVEPGTGTATTLKSARRC